MEAREHVVRQTTITLPYFEQELPALYLADGTASIPVIALCQMLGLHTATHIARWGRLTTGVVCAAGPMTSCIVPIGP